MKAFLKVDHNRYHELLSHLLPPNNYLEQGAFLFVKFHKFNRTHEIEVVDVLKLISNDFIIQTGYHLELSDITRRKVIKLAHETSTALVEVHSHIGPWPASFSPTDKSGLVDTVPHMWWRLKGKPYMAIVVSESGYDSLLWLDTPLKPRRLNGIQIDREIIKPTNISIRNWR
jgi:hypothetical protein